MDKLLEKELFPFGEMKGKKIKDIDENFLKGFIKSNAYRKNAKLRNLMIQHHKKLIQKSQKGGGKKDKKTQKKGKQHILHYFSADWCGYCKEFNPTWNQLVKTNKKKNIEFKKHSITDENENLLQIYNIQSFPTLLLVKNNGNRVKYQSDSRGKSEIEAFLKKNRI